VRVEFAVGGKPEFGGRLGGEVSVDGIRLPSAELFDFVFGESCGDGGVCGAAAEGVARIVRGIFAGGEDSLLEGGHKPGLAE
jgi:hypothetical protein